MGVHRDGGHDGASLPGGGGRVQLVAVLPSGAWRGWRWWWKRGSTSIHHDPPFLYFVERTEVKPTCWAELLFCVARVAVGTCRWCTGILLLLSALDDNSACLIKSPWKKVEKRGSQRIEVLATQVPPAFDAQEAHTVFTGLHNCLMDEKGRIAFPAPFRALLQEETGSDRFVLTASFHDACLDVMTEDAFKAKAEKVMALPPSNRAVLAFKRVVIAHATVVSFDKAGRVNIPKELRDYAGLEREAVWAGVVDKIELWSKGKFDELQRQRLAEPALLDEYQSYFESVGL